MDNISWIKNTSQFAEVQEKLEKDCKDLIDLYFLENDNYAIEKFLKVYTEGLGYLENSLLYKYRCAPEQMADLEVIHSNFKNAGEAMEAMEQVKVIMISEVKRQKRHATIFLSSVVNKPAIK